MTGKKITSTRILLLHNVLYLYFISVFTIYSDVAAAAAEKGTEGEDSRTTETARARAINRLMNQAKDVVSRPYLERFRYFKNCVTHTGA
jgi:uncharacterized protein YbjQ (UPF0145 family)